MGQIKSTFHDSVGQNAQDITVFLLMEGDTPITAYADKALADHDCWVCNDAQKYLDMEPFSYWVKPVGFYLDSPHEV